MSDQTKDKEKQPDQQDLKTGINRYGKETKTAIPDDAPLAANPGHKLRTSNTIVDRKALHNQQKDKEALEALRKETTKIEKLENKKQQLEFVQYEDQVGVVRLDLSWKDGSDTPNAFTGPSHRNQPQRFRFDGHKMAYHLDRVQDWIDGKRFAPIHIDMGLTKFCNVACLYCYAVVQNMTKGAMIAEKALLRYIEDCGKLGVRSIGFIGDGEPTLNPAVYDAAVLARKVGVDTSMATNGVRLDMDRAHDVLKNMTWVRINLSAGDAEGFARVHQASGESFHILMEKIKTLVALKKQSGNGKIYPCGPFFNKERFYCGDIHETSFYDIVMSDRYWAVHKDVSDSVDVHKDCAVGCRQDYINKYLWDLKNPPEHVNFI